MADRVKKWPTAEEAKRFIEGSMFHDNLVRIFSRTELYDMMTVIERPGAEADFHKSEGERDPWMITCVTYVEMPEPGEREILNTLEIRNKFWPTITVEDRRIVITSGRGAITLNLGVVNVLEAEAETPEIVFSGSN